MLIALIESAYVRFHKISLRLREPQGECGVYKLLIDENIVKEQIT